MHLFIKKAVQFAFRLRPVLAIDPRDGSTTISVDTRAAAEPDSLDAVMSTLEKIAADGKTCIVFDEFQDILKLDNANGILAQMRSTIQFPHAKVFSIDFTSRVNMPTSSVRRVLTRLVDDRHIYLRKDAYRFSIERFAVLQARPSP